MSLIIVGAGGFGREVFWHARDAHAAGGPGPVLGFADDNPHALDGMGMPVGIVGNVGGVAANPALEFVVAVGEPAARRRLAAGLAARGARLATVVHPSAHIAPGARLGPGCIVCPYAFVGTGASVGANTALNVYASVGHDAVVGENCVFSPYATINGQVALGSDVFLGTHACVLPRLDVGEGAKISAGSVVHRRVPMGALAAGNPARSREVFAPVGVHP